jgi:hypothetical protein
MNELTPQQWAQWVITGDPYTRVPSPMSDLAKRIELAIRQALLIERVKRNETIPNQTS